MHGEQYKTLFITVSIKNLSGLEYLLLSRNTFKKNPSHAKKLRTPVVPVPRMCVGAADPYCGWEKYQELCTPAPSQGPGAFSWHQALDSCPNISQPGKDRGHDDKGLGTFKD